MKEHIQSSLLAVLVALASLLTSHCARADKVFVANYGNSTIEQFTSSGVASLFVNTNLSNPIGLAFDHAGNLYVANIGNTIEKLTPDGVSSVFANTGLSGAIGLAFDSAGNLYAANNFNDTIEKFTPAGIGSLFANSGLSAPHGLAVDSAGNVYAANAINNTIEKFTPAGVGSLFANTGLNVPYGLAFDSGGILYAVNAGDNNIVKFTPGGTPSVFASTGLSNPLGLAFDSRDNLYVSNFNTNTIRKFTPAGVGSLFANTGMSSPAGLAFLPTPITLSKLLDTATAIPGGTGNFTSFHSPTFPAIAAQPGVGGGDVAFLGAGSAGQQGVYVMSNGPPIKLADVTTAIPGGTGNFTSFFPQLSTHGGAAAVRAAGSGGQQGIYRMGIGPPIKVADLNTAIPDGTDNFTSFPLASPAISSGNVAFVGSGSGGQQGVYVMSQGPPIKVADLNTAIPGGSGNFTGFSGEPALSGDNVAFIAGGSSGQQGIYVMQQGPPIKVADTATMIPGTADNFQSFESVSMDRSAVSSNLAFVGGGLVGGLPMKGVYVSHVGPPIKVADFATIIPAGAGMFSNFGAVAFDPDAAGNPITAFLGVGSAGQQGIYAQFDGTLRKVIDLGDLLDGKAPVSLSFGTSGLDLGQITFAATFTDGSEGLFTSKLPLALAGDYNGDGLVDAADYLVWRKTGGTAQDYQTWRTHFGQTVGSGAGASVNVAVPEPATLALLIVGMLVMSFRRRMIVS